MGYRCLLEGCDIYAKPIGYALVCIDCNNGEIKSFVNSIHGDTLTWDKNVLSASDAAEIQCEIAHFEAYCINLSICNVNNNGDYTFAFMTARDKESFFSDLM